MDKMTDSRAAEVQAQGGGEVVGDLRELRDRVSLHGLRGYESALDAAIAAMSAPPSAPVGVETMFILNREYLTRGGDKVKLVSIHNPGTDHETMACAAGVHRYTRRLHTLNFGRVTGTDGTDPRDLILPTLAQQPAAVDGEKCPWDGGSPFVEPMPAGMVYPKKPAPRAGGYLDTSGVEWNAWDAGQMEAYARAAYSDGWEAGYRAALAAQPGGSDNE